MVWFTRRFGGGGDEFGAEEGDCEGMCREEAWCECCDGVRREGVCRAGGGLDDGGSGFATGGGAAGFGSGGGRGVRITHLSIVQAGAGAVSRGLACYPWPFSVTNSFGVSSRHVGPKRRVRAAQRKVSAPRENGCEKPMLALAIDDIGMDIANGYLLE